MTTQNRQKSNDKKTNKKQNKKNLLQTINILIKADAQVEIHGGTAILSLETLL